MKHKRLGKGLEALIPQISEEEEMSNIHKESLAEIDISLIHSNPFQPRLEFDRAHLNELKQSIMENGVIQPITVRAIENGYELIAGERRFRAVQEIGFAQIPAYVMDVNSEGQMLELALVENIQREDLNPIDLAKA
jgi:ParB family chromosome partitioning protein